MSKKYWEFRGERLFALPPLAEDDAPDSFVDICEKFEVIEKHIDLISGEEKLLVNLYKPYAVKSVWLERNEISEKKIFDKLTHQGLSVKETFESAGLLKDVIVDTEENG
ncbi:MAG: hypothetical protein IJW21_09390, partial [Clostridia bacterium]|nr:hypothetical protein [Clostridia bacterium]